ncbi:MAG TPA: alpha-1,4-glucan--maltose-1-phosphate maltosyltransferase [Candidatus Nanopelagicaceae bacterium]|nr:alpha-1,4-glucan--maltose-1-phosphate maltosyltransferase [Candidatus Nanopelagicaceae bacterium]
MIGRVPIFDISPNVSGGKFPVKAVVGEEIEISATIFCEGHDVLGARIIALDPDGVGAVVAPLFEIWPGSDRWSGRITPTRIGDWSYFIEAWHDPIATWLNIAKIKIPSGMDVELVLEEGARLFEEFLETKSILTPELLTTVIINLRDSRATPQARLKWATSPEVGALISRTPLRYLVSNSESTPLQVDRERALAGAWYEFFPRSEGAEIKPKKKPKSGTFKTAMARLDAVAKMGFEVLYLPPVHPIGTSHRKGPNNSLTADPQDPGVPWAIGSSDGGHDAINPELGTLKDFEKFVSKAKSLGLEIALDLAFQASPDHPWVSDHPEWFTFRLDDSIAYAENPPKKYQDIYPLNFDKDYAGLLKEAIRVVRFWMDRGVRIFRVDNPHTKPLQFWQDLLANIRGTDPDVIFLAEAFTRPAMMHALGKAGFHQSYTYFTWRTTKRELEEYGREVSTYTSDFFRPNFWVNTPDILPLHLQGGEPEVFALRALLAATMSPSWGMYAGYELFEHEALEAGGEEYLDSEKYQLKPRDWLSAETSGKTLAPFVTSINRARKSHPALRQLRNLRFHSSDSDQVLAYSKRHGEDRVLVVANLDPTTLQETWIHLDMQALGLMEDVEFQVEDLLTRTTYSWRKDTFVRLDPKERVAHLLKVL